MIEDYEITPESSRHVLFFNVKGNSDKKRIAILLQHASWEQALEIYMGESSNLRLQKAQEMPISAFVIDKEMARELHAHLGGMIQEFEKD